MLAAVVEAVAELLADAPGRGRRLRARPPGRVGARLGRRERRAAEPDRRLAGQALAGGARPARRPRGRGQGGERAAVRPLLLRRQARLAARARRGGRARPRRRHAADGHGRLVPLRPPRRRLRHRPLDRARARSCSASTPPGFDPGAVRDLRRPARGAARDPRHRRRARHPPPPELAGRAARSAAQTVDQQAALAGRGRRRARPGQGDLRHRRLRPRPRRRGGPASPPAACCRRSPGASTAGPSTRSTAASSRPGRCSSGCAASSGSPTTRPRSASSPASADDSAGARVLPGARRDRRAVVAPGRARGARRAPRRHDPAPTSRARRSRASPGGSPTSSPRSARSSTVDSLRVDGGLTNEPLMLELQADAIGAPVEAAGADATVLGAAALAAVGSGHDRLARRGGRAAAGRPPRRARARRRLARGRARALARVRRPRPRRSTRV